MNNNIVIRCALPEDAQEILTAEREIAEEPGLFCSQPSELKLESVIKTITASENGEGLYLVAECAGVLAGHAFLEPHSIQSMRHVADLNIAVHVGWQKKGIGTMLLKHMIEWAKNSGVLRKIQLNVRATNLPAIALYKKMGFEEEGRLKKQVKVREDYVDDIIMALVI